MDRELFICHGEKEKSKEKNVVHRIHQYRARVYTSVHLFSSSSQPVRSFRGVVVMAFSNSPIFQLLRKTMLWKMGHERRRGGGNAHCKA